MNNVVTLLIDSVLWECVGNTRCKISPTPFMDSLKRESITASNLYSHGPYTDAATKSLYTGTNCLDDFGYYFRLNTAKSNHFKVFHQNGFETYGVYYPYYTVGPEIRKEIDHVYYSAGFIFKSEWGGIFNYYSIIIKERELNESEFLILSKRTKLMFDTWRTYYEDLINEPSSGVFIKDTISGVNIREKLKILQEEESKFAVNAKQFIYDLLEKGYSHVLATLDSIDIDKSIDRSLLTEIVYRKHHEEFSLFKKNNFQANVFKNAPSFKRLAKGIVRFIKNRNIDEIKFLANYYVCLRDIQKNIDKSYRHWQDIPSARRHLQFASDIISNHKGPKPFYLSLHILDPHNYVSFFSYDILKDDVISEEFTVLKKYVEELGTDFVGSLAYFLSLRYVDFCIEEFCNRLKSLGAWDNTTILFVADHGSSYSFYPLHGARVNCFDDECYHVPMMIRSPQIEGFDVNKYANSKDIFPTLFDVVGIETPDSFVGHSLIREETKPKDYVITEYMGPGCPDMLSRPIWFSIRDSHYIIAYKVGIYQKFEDGDLCEVYNLKTDPKGFYNIADKINRNSIDYLLEHLKWRLDEIKDSVNIFMEDLRKQ